MALELILTDTQREALAVLHDEGTVRSDNKHRITLNTVRSLAELELVRFRTYEDRKVRWTATLA